MAPTGNKAKRLSSVNRSTKTIHHHLHHQLLDNKSIGNCFQNMKHFSWIKLILVLFHLKYCYYNTPPQELHCLPYYFFNTILVMFFIGFRFLSYPICPHATSFGYMKPYAKPSHSNLLSSYKEIIKSYDSNTLPSKS